MSDSRWEDRFDRVVRALQWGALGLGAFLTFVSDGATPTALSATLMALAAVGLHQILPGRFRRVRGSGEVLTVIEVAAIMATVGLTGGLDSPFLLLSLTPVLYAGVFFGWRPGITTALLAGASLLGIENLKGRPSPVDPFLVGWISLYLLIAVTFGYARRLLVEAGEENAARSQLSEGERHRLDRLDTAHELLSRLSELADAADLNPIRVGTTALDHVAARVPFSGGVIALNGEDGPTVVARRLDHTGRSPVKLTVPLRVGNREVGMVTLARSEPFTEQEHAMLAQALQPVALAFANTLLLEEIGRRAVREERARLARELHDEIGPSLASLGLALDFALLRYPVEPDLGGHLAELRRNVTGLVEDVRSTVADLRAKRPTSLADHLRELAAGTDGPKVILDIDEADLPRPAVADQVAAILTEAFRNAVRHSGAAEIRVEGMVDRDTGSITVADDGAGFDEADIAVGHYGLIGMQERAAGVGARVDVESGPGAGTRVTVSWGDRR